MGVRGGAGEGQERSAQPHIGGVPVSVSSRGQKPPSGPPPPSLGPWIVTRAQRESGQVHRGQTSIGCSLCF